MSYKDDPNHTELEFYVAPTGAPLNVMLSTMTSRVMEFTWLPPEPTMRNGRITGYNLTCFITDSVMEQIGDVYPPQENYILPDFRPGKEYTCQVVAVNGAGSGPSAVVTVQAPEDSKPISLVYPTLVPPLIVSGSHLHILRF